MGKGAGAGERGEGGDQDTEIQNNDDIIVSENDDDEEDDEDK